MKSVACLLFVFMFLTSVIVEGSEADDELKLGVFPRQPALETKIAYTPLSKFLESRLGKKVKLVVSKDMAAFEEQLYSGVFDIVHLTHVQYVYVRRSPGYEAVAMNKDYGNSEFRAAIYVRKDSDIKSLADLKGKKIFFEGGGRHFCAFAAQKMLRDAGLKEGDYTVGLAINPPSAVIALSRGKGDAAGAGAKVVKFQIITHAGDDKNVRIFASSEIYPNHPWAVKSTLNRELKDNIKDALLSLNDAPEGKGILTPAGLDGFVEADDAQYDMVADVIHSLEMTGTQ